ncbi:cell surface protein [Lysobacter sp. TY2-98]|uniref:cell surface protein n=1 Tax=Lysobacter sp. TY2-98 TaxID=2290922 RepID=UPI000E1FD462|nr:cell surface protein [Lysobacter sp. TY2-98]AXK73183.1 cell surface protein [Lysobacter sp. TY2-98]
MKLRHSLLAIGLVAVASPAFAFGDTEIHNLTVSADIAETDALVLAFGAFEVSSKSAAVADQTQENVLNASYGDGDHYAKFGDSALFGAQGNIGVNVSAGVGNEQANDAALSSVDAGKVFATAMGTSLQIVEGNYAETSDIDTNYTAEMAGNALALSRGNIGVNVAAGVGNTQGNTMTGSVNTSGRYAIATSASAQLTLGNELNSDTWSFSDLDVYATLGGNALYGAQGNIGVNVAAGVGNAQHNGLSIASAVDGP